MKIVKAAWIFDVDGVITNPQEKKITQPEILHEIVKRLERKELVAINTGRTIAWVKDKVLNLLIKIIKEKKLLLNLLIVGEKGGTWAEFNEQNNLIENIDNKISVPGSLKDIVRNLINDRYSASMFYDEPKSTMISVEMKDGYPLDDYQKKQPALLAQFKALLKSKNLENEFKIDPTTIATDIENKFVGKNFAVKRIIKWIKNKGINPQKYITFGDSFSSDLPMAQEIYSQGFPVEFVYVGEESIDVSKYSFPIIITQNKFEKGTLEFLKSL